MLLADVVWVEWLVQPLVNTLKMLIGRENRAVMCYKLRSNVIDQKFRRSLEAAGLKIEELSSIRDHLVCQITANSEF